MKHLLLIIKNHITLVRSVYIMALVVIVPLLLTPWLTNHEPPLVAQPIILALAVAAFLTVWMIREAQRVRLSNPLRKHYIDSFIPGGMFGLTVVLPIIAITVLAVPASLADLPPVSMALGLLDDPTVMITRAECGVFTAWMAVTALTTLLELTDLERGAKIIAPIHLSVATLTAVLAAVATAGIERSSLCAVLLIVSVSAHTARVNTSAIRNRNGRGFNGIAMHRVTTARLRRKAWLRNFNERGAISLMHPIETLVEGFKESRHLAATVGSIGVSEQDGWYKVGLQQNREAFKNSLEWIGNLIQQISGARHKTIGAGPAGNIVYISQSPVTDAPGRDEFRTQQEEQALLEEEGNYGP